MTIASRNTCLRLVLILFVVANVVAQEPDEAWIQEFRAPYYVALYVEDIDRSATWYTTVFGLRPLSGSAADDGSWQIENLGNENLLVELIRDHRAKDVDRARGFRKFGFYVPDVEDVATRIERATGERPRIVEFEELEQRILQIRDPDGNTIQLLSTLEKKK